MTTEEKVRKYLSEIERNNLKGNRINAILQINPNALLDAREVDSKIKKLPKISLSATSNFSLSKSDMSEMRSISCISEHAQEPHGVSRRGLQSTVLDTASCRVLNPDLEIKKGRAGRLAGLVIAVKANINVKNMNASCASLTLKNYIAPYDATVIKKIKKEDGVIIGVCNMDEFACGASGETSAFGVCKNPSAMNLIPGGSSSGSAAAVAAGFCDVSLGSDTGGSIRNPASHCGVVGVKPSYGVVSRYGLIDLSMSLDQIGVISKNVETAMLVLDVIKGRDERDAVSYESREIRLEKINKLKIGLPNINITDKRIQELINKKVSDISGKNKWNLEKIEINHINLGVQTYYPLVYVEFFSGTRKFDGRRFGKKIEDSCGEEVLRRILGGSEISKAEFKGLYYRRALKAKSLIKREFEKAFEKVDCIIIPTVPRLPHKIGTKISVEEMYSYDALTVLANLAEIPAISVPAGKIDNVSVGLQILCPRFGEARMFSIAKMFCGGENE